MAGQTKIKFVVPPKFKGTLDEDASEWLERYESTGLYNRWEPADLAANFGMYLEDSARKWFICTTLPDHWNNVPEVVGRAAAQNVEEVIAVPAQEGLKTKFLQEFQRENYALFQEAKLRNREQGNEEETSIYYYDVLSLCSSVDPAAEASMIANRKGWTAKAIDIKLKATTVANIAVEADEDRIQPITYVKFHVLA